MTKKASAAPWSVKGVERTTRAVARQSAQAAGMTVGSWIEQAIREHAKLLPAAGAIAAESESPQVSEVIAAANRAEIRAIETGVERVETRADDMVIPVALKVQELAHRLVEIERARVAGTTREVRPQPAEPPPVVPPEPPAAEPIRAEWPPPAAEPRAEVQPEPPPEEPRFTLPPEPPVDDFPDPVPPPDTSRQPVGELRLEQLAPDFDTLQIKEPEKPAARPRPSRRRSRVGRVIGTLAAALIALVLGAGSAFVLLEHGDRLGLPDDLAGAMAEHLERAAAGGRMALASGEELVRGWADGLRGLWERHVGSEAPTESGATAVVPLGQSAEKPAAEKPAPEKAAPEKPAEVAALAPPPVAPASLPAAPAPETTVALTPPAASPGPPPASPAAAPRMTGGTGAQPAAMPPATPPAVALAPTTEETSKSAEPTSASTAALPQPPASAAAPARSSEELEKTARQGDVKAQYELGVAAAQPESGTPDYGKAAYWFREAAVQGNASAQYNLGVLYEHGLGVGQDDVRALLWYHSAAEQGHARAQYNLGVFYAQGRGIPTDYGEAQRWFKRAADQGVAKAWYNLAVLAEAGLGGPANPTAARAFMSRAALLGDAEARAALADIAKRPGGKADGAVRSTTELVGAIQHALSELGHDPGRIDGTLGDKTRQAIRRFQREAGMPQTGLPSEELLEALTAKLDKTPKATAVR